MAQGSPRGRVSPEELIGQEVPVSHSSMDAPMGEPAATRAGQDITEVARSWPRRFAGQYVALFKKNTILGYRNWRATVIQLCASFFFLLMLLLIDWAVKNDSQRQDRFKDVREPGVEAITNIPDCKEDMFMKDKAFDCYTLAYTPSNNAAVDAVIASVMANNDPPIPQEKVLSFNDPTETDDWMLANPERLLSAVHFVNVTTTAMEFGIQTNSTPKFFKGQYQSPDRFVRVPLQVAVEREIARYFVNRDVGADVASRLTWRWSLSEFAHPVVSSFSIVGAAGGNFVFAAALFGFVLQIADIVTEKEKRLRQSLRTMGMLDSAFWLSWVSWHLVFDLFSTLTLVSFGYLLQFDLFLKNDFPLMFFLVLLFQMAMSGFALVVAAFLKSAQVATNIGFILFLLGWIIQIAVLFGFPFTPELSGFGSGLPYAIFTLMPWALLSKGIGDLGTASTGTNGLEWGQRESYCKDYFFLDPEDWPEDICYPGDKYVDCNCIMPLSDIYNILFALWVGYTILGIYLDNVITNESGNSLPPFYFLYPSYWSARVTAGSLGAVRAVERDAARHPSDASEGDPDVCAAALAAKDRLHEVAAGHEPSASREYAIEMFGLRKVFGGGFLRGKRGFAAVEGTWLQVERNHLFCLLGPNGAGKTTTFNMLTGVTSPTSGDVLVDGRPLSNPGDLDRTRGNMGVCPQFDVLWDRLTGLEHLDLYCGIKGVVRSARQAHCAQLLHEVALTDAQRVRVGSYSGGMRRRLSVALALLGSPSIVYLDEPTTGMDPVSRRFVWDIIERAKKGRCIILTTHSMEEADILGDRIGIMARGKLRCVGTPLHLKGRFGAGYNLYVTIERVQGKTLAALRTGVEDNDPAALEHAARVQRIRAFMKEQCGLEPFEETPGFLTYVLPREDKAGDAAGGVSIRALMEGLEQHGKALGVADVQLSTASLEEVFLTIARNAEIDALSGEGRTFAFLMEDGREVQIPLGAEVVRMAAGEFEGMLMKVQWSQDDEGNLQVFDLKPMTPEEEAALGLHTAANSSDGTPEAT
ncbi:unnamed protein product [Pedinophyceae sp. YPF-701]|nr:unnamed protein product [Pedinophyceae sp. YPF-701]